MSGWIKLSRATVESLRFRRLVKELSRRVTRDVTNAAVANETIVLGALARLWLYADAHVGDDNLVEATLEEIDEVVGVQGFAQCLPADWLQVVDPNHVKLPDFLAHNGTSAKARRQAAVRQARYRNRSRNASPARNVTSDSSSRNASRRECNDARQTDRQDRTEEERAADVPRGTQPAGELYAQALEEWRTEPGVSITAGENWIRYCETVLKPPKPLQAMARIAMAKLLRGMGSPSVQEATVTKCIANGWRNLRPADADAKTPAPTNGDALQKLKDRRQHIGLPNFRDPRDGETADQYREAQDAEFKRRQTPGPVRFGAKTA